MQEIADWLEKLGMSEYAERFAENGIDTLGPPSLDRSGPQRAGRLARPSAKDAGRDREVATDTATAPKVFEPSRSPKTPPSAAKSR